MRVQKIEKNKDRKHKKVIIQYVPFSEQRFQNSQWNLKLCKQLRSIISSTVLQMKHCFKKSPG